MAFTGVLADNGIAINMDGKGAWRDNSSLSSDAGPSAERHRRRAARPAASNQRT
jgi:hypothetical protein